jgi:hypothetical protein
MAGNWDPFDPVQHRTMFYEKIQQADKTFIRFLPFYMVQYPNMHGKMFEPVDCLKRKQLGGDASNSSAYAMKEINEIIEYDPKSKIFYAEDAPDTTLHAFGGCEWPR